MNPNITISLAPLQGITEFPFRNALQKFMGGVDKFYAPFLRMEKGNKIRPSKLKDVLPENNQLIKLIPQVMTNNAGDLIFLTKILTDLGYEEINLNMGCPFPMVVKRKLGSGLLPYAEQVVKMLDRALPEISCKLSIKMRLGQTTAKEISQLLPFLNDYPLHEIIIHPRLGIQQYKGQINFEAFGECLELTTHPLTYNGDITRIEHYLKLKRRFPQVKHWMIGRGLVTNPFLGLEIKNEGQIPVSEKREQFSLLHASLSEHYHSTLSGEAHFLMKMLSFWEYFSQTFDTGQKVFKKLRKAKTIAVYQQRAAEILKNFPLQEIN